LTQRRAPLVTHSFSVRVDIASLANPFER